MAVQQEQTPLKTPLPEETEMDAMVEDSPDLDAIYRSRQRALVRARFNVGPRYVVLDPVAYGAHGLVWFAQDNQSDKQRVAVKKVSDPFRKDSSARRILREVSMLRYLDHPNLLKGYDVLLRRSECDREELYLVTHAMDLDLHRVIHSSQKLTKAHVVFFMYQALCGTAHLHSAEVIHRDIKPANLLLNTDCRLKLADFGHARSLPDSPSVCLTEYVVTRHYRAPELLMESERYGPAVDVWSLGCVLAELLGREPLFPGSSYADQLTRIVQVCGTPEEETISRVGNLDARSFLRDLKPRPPVPPHVLFPGASRPALEVLHGLLRFDPEQRWTARGALRAQWFNRTRDPSCEDPPVAPLRLCFRPEEMCAADCRRVLSQWAKEDDA
eukprot:Hpha_TRINITY_DN35050_c0_g1::TRINITY_DN35050_c0_g1_i1::g.82675::m.82675